MVVGFVVSGGADPARFAFGAALVVFGLASYEATRRRRRVEASQPDEPEAPDRLGYRLREALLGAVLAATALAAVLVDGRPRVPFAFFAVMAAVLLVRLELRRRRDRGG